FETAVSEAASLALHLLGKSDRVGLLVGSTLVPPGSGAGQRRAILETLALVKRDEAGGAPASLPSGAIVYTVRARSSSAPERSAA
ncbi:MAG: hypothetical protein JNK60_00600, partial [Acidobacteria bacterium]|nr:hypothetical protein [Acidobacteriota bacterium]